MQVRDTSSSMNNGKALINECAERFQVNGSMEKKYHHIERK